MRRGSVQRAMPKVVMGRVELIEALEGRRSWARKYDQKRLRDHQRQEKVALKIWRERCRAALSWDYKQLEEENFEIKVPYNERTSCPNSAEVSLDTALDVLKLDNRATITLTDQNENHKILWLLTHDEDRKLEVC